MVTKAYILKEIKRTTKENGGKPLGHRKFEAETGIKTTEWRGKHWARWGDAVREAGYTPNQLTGAYDDSVLLEKYAQLACELKHLPTSSDIRLKASNTPMYPSNTTFERLGTKSEIVQQLLEHCKNRDDFDAVVHMCKAYSPRKQNRVSKITSNQTEHDGFVYLLKSGRFYKIGRTTAPGRREYELAIQLPEKVKPVHSIRTDDPSGIEAYWHKRFKGKRKNGEWFELNAADVAAFKRRKFM